MGLNRRRVVQLGTAATLLPGVSFAAADQNEAFEQALSDTLTRLKSTFSGLGLTEAKPLSIVTGDETYNGGLRHDFDQSLLPTNAFVIQPLARVGDVDEKSRADVLPVFHEVGCHPENADGQATTRLMIQILTKDFDLDLSRLSFVSVPKSEAMRGVLDEMRLPFAEKVLLRDEAEALSARDASGYFFPDPLGDEYVVTMGVYYRVGETDEAAPSAYPPSDNWTEIGEIVIGGAAVPLGLSIGAERLTYVLTGQYPTWDERLGALFTLVDQDSTDGSPPPGLTAFQ